MTRREPTARRLWGWVSVVMLAVAPACGAGNGGPTAPTPAMTTTATRGQASDPTGDAVSSPGLRVPPDLTQATLTASNGVMTVSVRFAPGTFDRATLSTQVVFDTDQQTSTGLPGIGTDGPDGGVIGADMLLNVEPTESYLIDCRTSRPGQCVGGGAVPGTVFVADGFDVSVSLTQLGDDGRLSFKVLVGGIFGSGRTASYTDDLDVMPDVGRPAVRVE